MTNLSPEARAEVIRIMRAALARFAADHPELSREPARPTYPKPLPPTPVKEVSHDDAA